MDLNYLVQRLSQLNDGELLKMVTTDSANYREDALALAHKELASRGINANEPTEEGEDEETAAVSSEGLVTVATFTTAEDAEAALERLTAEGISAWLGYEVVVDAPDAKAARTLLAAE